MNLKFIIQTSSSQTSLRELILSYQGAELNLDL